VREVKIKFFRSHRQRRVSNKERERREEKREERRPQKPPVFLFFWWLFCTIFVLHFILFVCCFCSPPFLFVKKDFCLLQSEKRAREEGQHD